jgi:TolA-binding protein
MSFARIIPLLWATLPILQDSDLPTPDNLYRQAHTALESQNTDTAAVYLTCLVNLYPDCELSAVAIVTLVEFDLIRQRHLKAVEKMIEWSDQILDKSWQPDQISDPAQLYRWQLLATAVDGLDQQQSDSLGSSLTQSDRAASNAERFLARELGRRALQHQQPLKALEYFDWLGDSADPRERQLRDHAIPVYLLQTEPSEEVAQLARSRLDKIDRSQFSQRFQLHWAIVEAYCQHSKHELALTELASLSRWLEGLTPPTSVTNRKQSGDTAVHVGEAAVQGGDTAVHGEATTESESAAIAERQVRDWQAATELKRAELLAISEQKSEAVSIATAALEKFPEFPGRPGFRFLLTRCHIADIELEKAIDQLQAVLREASHCAETQAKAYWMSGEIRLMQRRHAEAVEHYTAVLDVSGQSQWGGPALFQMAKCREAMSQPMLAVSLYQDLLRKFPESELSTLAQERLSSLSSLMR